GVKFSINRIIHSVITKSTRTTITKIIWRKPEENWYKLNVDRASKGNLGPSRIGGLIRDWKGEVVLAFNDFVGHNTNTEAEMIAVVQRLQLQLIWGLPSCGLNLIP
ncbi:hypothetical protein Pfo_016402, partial [Paulownia fortunei]